MGEGVSKAREVVECVGQVNLDKQRVVNVDKKWGSLWANWEGVNLNLWGRDEELTLRNFQGYVELTSEFGDMKQGWECMDTKVKGFE